MTRFYISWIFCLVLLWAYTARASTIYVYGNMSGTWAADTVMVVGDVDVLDGSTLNINPGTDVIFMGHFQLTIGGNAYLHAVGTVDDSISFTALNPVIGWGGIRFVDIGASGLLEYCHLSYVSNEAGGDGYGAIYIYENSPTITHTRIDNCSAGSGGGIAIRYDVSRPLISDCIITANSANRGGGIYAYYDVEVTITGCVIEGNYAGDEGGGIYLEDATEAIVTNNLIINNTALTGYGGGLYCEYNTAITGNYFAGNTSYSGGGGCYLRGSGVSFNENVVVGNTVLDGSGGGARFYDVTDTLENNLFANNTTLGVEREGGGVYTYNGYPKFVNCTFSGNEATAEGGGLYVYTAAASVYNSIIWGNYPHQLSQGASAYVGVNYSDIEDTLWSGSGNISDNPLFVNQARGDSRLQWGSPCIDRGSMSATYNDPDGTRNDMGFVYYDQSIPVRCILTPTSHPLTVAASGGRVDFTMQVTSIDTTPLNVELWSTIALPCGRITGAQCGPVVLTLDPGSTSARQKTQMVTAEAPAGLYSYNFYAVAGGDTTSDSFPFFKYSGYTEASEFARIQFHEGIMVSEGVDKTYNILEFSACNYPEPFNSATTIHYILPSFSHVNLAIFDLHGRRIRNLVNGWQQPGTHQVIFDASALASGLYFYHLQYGRQSYTKEIHYLK